MESLRDIVVEKQNDYKNDDFILEGQLESVTFVLFLHLHLCLFVVRVRLPPFASASNLLLPLSWCYCCNELTKQK